LVVPRDDKRRRGRDLLGVPLNWTFPRSLSGGETAAEAEARLADAFLEAYIDWRDECLIVEMAYERWQIEPHPDRAIAFAAYRAALDREEHAAGMFRERTARIAAA
jgi:hypothetical protein